MSWQLEVAPDEASQSLERFIAARLDLHRLIVRRWILDGWVTVDGTPGKASRFVCPRQRIVVTRPPLRPHEALPQDLALPIRFQDDHVIVVAKPAGMATHPGPGWWRGSCVNGLLHAVKDWPGIGGVAGPGVVHRLDRDTTGLLVFAKSELAHQALLLAAKEHRLERRYLAWVEGQLTGEGTIDLPLGRDAQEPQRVVVRADGKRAVTHWRSLEIQGDRSRLELTLETGRNHQIRVHLAHLGHPVLGDAVYGRAGTVMALHAFQLAFVHPISGEPLQFEEPPPWA